MGTTISRAPASDAVSETDDWYADLDLVRNASIDRWPRRHP